MKLNTDLIKQKLAQTLSLEEKSIKRLTKKKNEYGDIVRTFEANNITYFVTTNSSDTDYVSITKGGENLLPKALPEKPNPYSNFIFAIDMNVDDPTGIFPYDVAIEVKGNTTSRYNPEGSKALRKLALPSYLDDQATCFTAYVLDYKQILSDLENLGMIYSDDLAKHMDKALHWQCFKKNPTKAKKGKLSISDLKQSLAPFANPKRLKNTSTYKDAYTITRKFTDYDSYNKISMSQHKAAVKYACGALDSLLQGVHYRVVTDKKDTEILEISVVNNLSYNTKVLFEKHKDGHENHRPALKKQDLIFCISKDINHKDFSHLIEPNEFALIVTLKKVFKKEGTGSIYVDNFSEKTSDEDLAYFDEEFDKAFENTTFSFDQIMSEELIFHGSKSGENVSIEMLREVKEALEKQGFEYCDELVKKLHKEHYADNDRVRAWYLKKELE